jgi:hypothetical protein
MLETRELDDKVSQKLFANLAYIDTVESTDILSRVTMNENIPEKERFRSLMGLKNTSAPVDADLMDSIIEYGFSSSDGDDSMRDATGMLVGTMAKERVDRAPEQANHIAEAIISAIGTDSSKVVSMGAAGNMLQSAPDELVQTVDDVLLSAGDSSTRAKSANALSRMERTEIAIDTFQTLLMDEDNSGTVTQLIKASTVAKDFQSNEKFRAVLVDISNNRSKQKPNRLAALKALEKASYGATEEERQALRKLMIGERDRDISKMLKKLYRK